jgi:hypothetical protein
MLNASGGGGSLLGKKSELVADITKAFQDLNRELEKTKKLSEDISKNLKASRGGSGGSSIADTGSNSTGTKDPLQNDGSQTGGNGGFNLKSILNFGAKVGGLAMQAMPSLQEVFAQDVASSQAGFYSGGGRGFGAAQQRSLASQGTFGSTQDVYQAQMAMNAFNMNGKNNATMQGNVAAMSNLTAGMGFSAAQQVGAVQALNSGRSVNMARMIGVNIRGADGMMRGFKDIAKDLWNTLNRQKQGGAALSKNDIQFSLQPGNALDSLMNQYFGSDPVLRQSVVNELLMMAGGSGGATTKSATQAQGLSTNSMNVIAAKTASQVNVQQAAAKYELKGMDEANKALTTLNNHFADLIVKSKALQKILEGKGFLDTMSQAGHGAGSGVMGLLGGLGGSFLSKGFGSIKNMLMGGEEGGGMLGGLKSFGSKALKFGKGLASGAAVYEGLDYLQAILNQKFGDKVPSWVNTAGNFAFDLGKGAASGAATGKNPLSAVAGMVMMGGKDIVRGSTDKGGNLFGFDPLGVNHGGSDTGNEDATHMMANPLAHNPPITSPFGRVRNIIFANGEKSPSYGKKHGGVDFGVSEGNPVYAVKDGVIQETTYDKGGFGNYGKIKHEDGRVSYYGHMSSLLAKAGENVKAGDLIGYSGNSGNSTGPHLHFEVRDGGQAIDPLNYISGAEDSKGGEGSHPLKKNAYKITGGAGALMITPMGGEGDVGAPSFTSRAGKQRSSQGINYGGVTITMNFPTGNYDPQKIKDAVREVISHDNIREHAVSK